MSCFKHDNGPREQNNVLFLNWQTDVTTRYLCKCNKLCVSPMTFLLTFRSDRYGSLDYLFLIDLIFWKTVIIMVHIFRLVHCRYRATGDINNVIRSFLILRSSLMNEVRGLHLCKSLTNSVTVAMISISNWWSVSASRICCIHNAATTSV